MATVFLSLGSNTHREYYLASAKEALAQLFGEVHYSSIYESEAVGFNGDPFYNLVAQVETSLSINQLSIQLKRIEDDCDRDRSAPKFSGRTLDIDLLTYDDFIGSIQEIELPRPEILQQAFVLWPMAELAPKRLHPKTQQCYQDLWQEFKTRQPQKAAALHPIALSISELCLCQSPL
jgi:2-amino-4-hydroxy-6-hydroxymethyldihydropteridine diphosphokinase